jgi:hypothetical protein
MEISTTTDCDNLDFWSKIAVKKSDNQWNEYGKLCLN